MITPVNDRRLSGINREEFTCLSTDVASLPTDVDNGSCALCIDNGKLYFFNADTKTWAEPQEG